MYVFTLTSKTPAPLKGTSVIWLKTFNSKVGDYETKAYTAPSWAESEASIDGSVVERESVWDARNPQELIIPDDEDESVSIEWLSDRVNAYGPVSTQIEFIVENGLDAWIEEVKQIKADNPKE